MSTQHPDNITPPFFAETPQMEGNDEIEEAFYSYSHLGVGEQMWDYEGKEVDGFVVKKLLTKYKSFFDEHRLGKDIFLTLRVPNPEFEKTEAKILVETLESIPRSFDESNILYNDDIPPIFEVILPMTQSENSLDRIYNYYQKFVIGKQDYQVMEGDMKIAEWVGKFAPDKINVIPLVEDKEHMLFSHHIVHAYLSDKDVEYQRVFYARSDPALNYGLLSAVLINKLAHMHLHDLSEQISIELLPILGVGSSPFRANLRQETLQRVVDEYPSVQTFTIQSAFKYDNPPNKVFEAIQKLKETPRRTPHYLEQEKCLELIEKYSKSYSEQIIKLAPVINKVANFVPKRRKRKLHIGLFGYCRSVGDFCLPRAISFTASLCSIGLPPSLLGLKCLNQKDYDFIKTQYIYFEEDLVDALKFYNPDQDLIPYDIEGKLKDFSIDFEIDEEHKKITDRIIKSVKKDNPVDITRDISLAANLRRFLG